MQWSVKDGWQKEGRREWGREQRREEERREVIRHSIRDLCKDASAAEDGRRRRRCSRPMGANFAPAHSFHPRILSHIGSHDECQVGDGESQNGRKLGVPDPILLPLLTRKISGIRIELSLTGPRPTLLRHKISLKASHTS